MYKAYEDKKKKAKSELCCTAESKPVQAQKPARSHTPHSVNSNTRWDQKAISWTFMKRSGARSYTHHLVHHQNPT
jgi:hypothetical protein